MSDKAIDPNESGLEAAKKSQSKLSSIKKRLTPDWLTSLSQRLVTAGIAIPIVVVAVWFGGWADVALGILILGLGIYELKKMFEKLGYRPLTILSFCFGSSLFLGILLLPAYRQTIMEVMVMLLVLGSLSWLLITRHKLGTALMDWALTLVMALYLAWPLSYLIALRGDVIGSSSPAFWYMLIVFFGDWAFDSAAYFSGRFMGKHLLAPVVSPGKTWEGVIGGFFLCLAAVYVFSIPIRGIFAWYHAIALAILISFAATIGDLAESLIKRQAHVKDSGTFFRGHGGVLDRIDSLLFVAVVVYFYVTLVL